MNANQYGALVSWTFNLGAPTVRGSPLIERLNDYRSGDTVGTVIAEELPKYIYAAKGESRGLVRRRAAEVELAATATFDAGLPPC